MTVLSAHQPNFFPWLPFFEKVRDADVFVILIHAQFVKGNYHNRFYLDGKWNTMSVNKGTSPLSDKRYVQPERDWESIKSRNVRFSETLATFDSCVSGSLIEFNSAVIRTAAKRLAITTPIIEEPESMGNASTRLINICHQYQADTYLSGPSGHKYLDIDLFQSNGIDVRFVSPSLNAPLLEAIK